MLAAVIGVISGLIIHYSGLGKFILTFLTNSAKSLLLRIGAGIAAIVAWLGGICYGIGQLVYHGLNYLIL